MKKTDKLRVWTPLGKPGVTYLYLWQREALNMPKKQYPPNCKQWRITARGHKGRAVGKGTEKQASLRTWSWLDVLIKEKAACLLTGGRVSEYDRPSVLHTSATSAQRRDRPSAEPLL